MNVRSSYTPALLCPEPRTWREMMQDWGVRIIIGIVTAAVTLLVAWFGLPKLRAEAQLTLAQAEAAIWLRWQREIKRLERVVTEQGRELDNLRGMVRGMAQNEISYLRDIAQRDERIVELEDIITKMPIKMAMHPTAAGVGGALSYAHRIEPDEAGEDMRRMIEGVKRSDEAGDEK